MVTAQTHGSGRFRLDELGSLGEGVVIEEGVLIFNPAHVHLADGVYVGHRAMLKGDTRGELVVEDGAWIGQDCYLHAAGGIHIGRRAGIGPRVMMLTSTHSETPPPAPIIDAPVEFAPVEAGEGCDIGIAAILLPGARIGAGAQIGAGTLVTGEIPPGMVAAGVPHGSSGVGGSARADGEAPPATPRRARFWARRISRDRARARSGQLTQGPMVERFEQAVADLCGVRHAIAVTSATTALELGLAALDIGPGSEVLIADFTYPATGNAVLQRGARLRLLEVDPRTYCLDPDALAAAISDRTSAVIAVDLFGLPADYSRIETLLARRGIPLLCDAACALGGEIGTRRCGSFGQLSAFSFHPRKSLTTGEGGMVTTDDGHLAARMRRLRNHGSERDGWRAQFVEPGFNFRMSELNAALGLVQVPEYPQVVGRRRTLARVLDDQLIGIDGVTPQLEPEGHRHPYQSYVVTLADSIDRDAVLGALRDSGIEATLGTYALHSEPAFVARCGTRPGDIPESYRLMQQTLALPLHQRLHERDMELIAVALREAIQRPESRRAQRTTRPSA